MKKSKAYVFDLECTSAEPSHAYMASLCKLEAATVDDVQLIYDASHRNHEKTIGKIVDALFKLPNNSTVYVHNLSYDISFVLCYLFKYRKGEFSILQSVIMPLTKSYMSISIVLNGKKLKFKDTFILFSAPLANVMKAYTTYTKGETPLFDYKEEVIIDSYVCQYSKIDVLALATALRERLTMGNGKLTTASGAMDTFKEIINTKFSNNYENLFPCLTPEADKVIRKGYRGGFTYLNPMYKEKKLKRVQVIDVNSMYPAQMKFKKLPWGEPYYMDGEVEPNSLYDIGLQKVYFDSCIIKDGYLPFISVSNGFNGVNQYEEILDESLPPEKRTLLLTLDELALFKKSYHINNLKYEGGYLYRSRIGFFDEYIDKFWAMKNSPDPVKKALGKLFLNSLYGKFAEGIEKIIFEIGYDETKGLVYEQADIDIRPCGYLPMGIFITSYSRMFLVESILKIGVNNFVYCDTDSIHFINREIPDDLHMHPSDLGAWDFEGDYEEGYYIRAKKYILKEQSGKLKIACAGIKRPDLAREVTHIDMFRSGRAINTIKFKNGVNGKYTEKVTIQI